MTSTTEHRCIVIGAGPAGLTAACELGKAGVPGVVFESGASVGGLARTVEFDGYRLDIGGHRFFTKVDAIHELWQEALGDDLLQCSRLSRIHYNGHFFHYPLKPLNILRGLGLVESVRILQSYCRALASNAREETNFEQWVSNRFGSRLYEIFFKTYTEKVWGIPCTELSAEWAGQRLRNLDLVSALKNALLGSSRNKSSMITSLVEQFHYPRLGPGMMWERFGALAAERGVPTFLETRVCRIHHTDGRIVGVTVRDRGGDEQRESCAHLVSTMPLRTLVEILEPAPPAEVLAAARELRYRDFMTVGLIVDRSDIFPDNWIYVHSPEVNVGRIQNFKNWSAAMVPDQAKTLLGLEYFVSEGDDLWRRNDDELIRLGARECDQLGLVRADEVTGGIVLRQTGAYPIYAGPYRESLRAIRQWLGRFSNLHSIGRNGQHRYDNMDGSMLTAISAVGRITGRAAPRPEPGGDSEYLEEARQRPAAEPARDRSAVTDTIIARAFARCDPVALGTALGTVLALGMLIVSLIMQLSAEPSARITIALLANYFVGYRASLPGVLIGVAEMAVVGFVYGWVLGQLINLLIGGYEAALRREIEMARAMDEIDLPTHLGGE